MNSHATVGSVCFAVATVIALAGLLGAYKEGSLLENRMSGVYWTLFAIGIVEYLVGAAQT